MSGIDIDKWIEELDKLQDKVLGLDDVPKDIHPFLMYLRESPGLEWIKSIN